MNSRIINFILFILLIICLGVLFTFYDYNQKLESQILARDKTIDEINKTDSLLVERTKEYVKQIKKFNSQPSYILNGKKITTSEIVDLLNDSYIKNSKLEHENHYLKYKDSISSINSKISNYNINLLQNAHKKNNDLAQEYADSASINNAKLNYIKRHYGIYIKHKVIDSIKTIVYNDKMMKVDSALMLYPYYKNRLSFKNGEWNVEIDPGFEKLRKKQIEREESKKRRRN